MLVEGTSNNLIMSLGPELEFSRTFIAISGSNKLHHLHAIKIIFNQTSSFETSSFAL